MNTDLGELLREIVMLQKEQNELLKRYLWRLRFSLLTLLIVMTGVCVGLFAISRQLDSKRGIFVPATNPVAVGTSATPASPPNPTGFVPDRNSTLYPIPITPPTPPAYSGTK